MPELGHAFSATDSGPPTSQRNRQARRLFAGLGASYERIATLLSLGQDPTWRRALVASVGARPEHCVLDVASGTGMVVRELVRQYGCTVVGLDQSLEMLIAGRRHLSSRTQLVHGQAERLPFGDQTFDHVTFTYLLRYVDDPAATVAELVRVLRSGGRLAALEFGIPEQPFWHLLWFAYTRLGLPFAGRLLSPAWAGVGDFLGPSIERFYARHAQEVVEDYWRAAGLHDVVVRRMSLGGGIVMCATKGYLR